MTHSLLLPRVRSRGTLSGVGWRVRGEKGNRIESSVGRLASTGDQSGAVDASLRTAGSQQSSCPCHSVHRRTKRRPCTQPRGQARDDGTSCAAAGYSCAAVLRRVTAGSLQSSRPMNPIACHVLPDTSVRTTDMMLLWDVAVLVMLYIEMTRKTYHWHPRWRRVLPQQRRRAGRSA